MKLIITEKQLRLIIESEKEDNLMDLTGVYESGLSPNKWDNFFLFKKNKEGKEYKGYFIDGPIDKFGNKSVDLRNQEIDNLDYLVVVNGSLDLSRTNIKSLERLEYVNGYLDLYNTKISSLPNMKFIGGPLSIGGDNDKSMPPISKKQDLEKMFQIKGKIFK